MTDPRVLALNPGSTSTKLALFHGDRLILEENVAHGDAELAAYRNRPVLDQLPLRLDAVLHALAAHGVDPAGLDAAVGRGGLLRPLPGGTYRVSDEMLTELRAAGRGEHASNLGAFLARRLAERAGCPAYIVDPVSVDEWDDVARLSGLDGLDRDCLSHALNTKAVAKRYAAEVGRPYQELRLVVVHLGSGISVSAHRCGRMVDVTNSREEGPFSAERAGAVPTVRLVERVLREGLSFAAAEAMLFREGGIHSYLGTRDLREVERRIDAGDDRAALVLDAMLYQVRKEVGAMAAVLDGAVDAVLLTGGMARSQRVASELVARLGWVAPVEVYPGEDELRALAEGALRVLAGAEPHQPFRARIERHLVGLHRLAAAPCGDGLLPVLPVDEEEVGEAAQEDGAGELVVPELLGQAEGGVEEHGDAPGPARSPDRRGRRRP
jgi:butyrate kinase